MTRLEFEPQLPNGLGDFFGGFGPLVSLRFERMNNTYM